MQKDVVLDVIEYPEDFTVAEIVEVLECASDQYYNKLPDDPDPWLTDAEYDSLERHLKERDPANKYLIGVGSAVRGDKVKLPFPMSGLDQIYDEEIEGWIKNNKFEEELFQVSAKADGTSIMLVYDEHGDLQKAYSRGNGLEGQDVTRHARRFSFLPQDEVAIIGYNGTIVVRAEVVLDDDTFKLAQENGKIAERYKNPRNYVAGQMNSESADEAFYCAARIVVYEVMYPTHLSKQEESVFFMDSHFESVGSRHYDGNELNDELLTSLITTFKRDCRYALDGVVITLNDAQKRQNMTPRKGSSLNPVYAKKFKVADADNLATTTVQHVEWKVSKNGYLKPRVWVDPVELVGVTVSKATAFNAKFINDNKIGPGTVIEITRSGDVIPFILNVVKSTAPQVPDESVFGKYKWNKSYVDFILCDVSASRDAQCQQLIAFVQNLGIEFLGPESVTKLFDAGFDTPAKLITATLNDFRTNIGQANGEKAMKSMMAILREVPPYMLAGSGGFFGRGIGRRKLKKIFDVFSDYTLKTVTLEDICSVEGFDSKTAQQVIDNVANYWDFLEEVDGYYAFAAPTLSTGGRFDGEAVVFTGFRDKDAMAVIEAQGGKVSSGVSKNTTLVVTKDPNSTSSKIQKARDLGIKIIGPDELYDMIG